MVVWMLVGGLASCDSTAKFSLPDRKFSDVQVVTAFPAFVDESTGSISRVCGVALTDAEKANPLAANGLEFNVNFVSTELKTPSCEPDRDQSIKAGDLIELFPVQTGGADATVSAKNFSINVDCIEGYGPAGACKNKTIALSNAPPSVVNYKELAPRCDPTSESTRLNVALLMDHSGSVTGFVDKTSFKEDDPAKGDWPVDLNVTKSDLNHARIPAAEFFIDALNDRDRLIGYYYNEKVNIAVAASDNLACVGGGEDGKKCISNSNCKSGACFPGNATDGDSFELATLAQAEAEAFGSNEKTRVYLKTALSDKVKYGKPDNGRTPLWEAMSKAYSMLKTKVKGNRHIVVVSDGPDTCTESEDFNFKGTDGKCRTPCQNAFENFKVVRQQMADDGYPVIVHFVQFQAKGYRNPDAHMMEIACRTGGTFQFINTEEINKADAQAISTAMNRALIRVRYSLSGSWRVGLKLQAMTAGGAIPTGKLQAVAGHLRFENPKFPSLATVYETQTSWKFGVETANEDRRVIFRKGCSGHKSCGGAADGFGDAECSSNHCTEDGLCKSGAAPNNLRCGSGSAQRCCDGKCAADCKKDCP